MSRGQALDALIDALADVDTEVLTEVLDLVQPQRLDYLLTLREQKARLGGVIAALEAGCAQDELARKQAALDVANAKRLAKDPDAEPRTLGATFKFTDLTGRTWQASRSDKTQWEHPLLALRVAQAAAVDEQGEVQLDLDAARRIASLLVDCAGISYWRKTALRDHAITFEDALTTEQGRYSLSLIEVPGVAEAVA